MNFCEKFYNNHAPPLNIQLAADIQNVNGVPFTNEFAYLTIFLGDLDKIDDLQLTIRATTSSFLNKDKIENRQEKWSKQENKKIVLKDDDSLNEYLIQEKQKEFERNQNYRLNLQSLK